MAKYAFQNPEGPNPNQRVGQRNVHTGGSGRFGAELHRKGTTGPAPIRLPKLPRVFRRK